MSDLISKLYQVLWKIPYHILFNCFALGIHLCTTWQLFNCKTKLGGEICPSDINMQKGHCKWEYIVKKSIPSKYRGHFVFVFLFNSDERKQSSMQLLYILKLISSCQNVLPSSAGYTFSRQWVKLTTCFGYLLICIWTHFSPTLGWSPRQGWFLMTLLETYLWRHTRWRLSPPSWILWKSAETVGERRRGRETSLIKENWLTFAGHCKYTNSPKKKNVAEFYWGWMGREHMLSMVKKGGWGQGKKIAVYV